MGKKVDLAKEVISVTFELLVGIAGLVEPIATMHVRSDIRDSRMEREAFIALRKEREDDRRRILRDCPQSNYSKYAQALASLRKANFVIENKKDKSIVLTQKGWVRLASLSANFHSKKKDAKKLNQKSNTYIVIFDVPEQHRKIRDSLRRCLNNLGFVQIQKSCFAVQDKDAYVFVKAMIERIGIKEYIKCIEASKVE